MLSSRPVSFRLYAVTDRHQLGGRALEDALEGLCRSGLRGVQVRERDLDEAGLAELVALCRPVLDRHGVAWLVNGSIGVAQRSGATGLHLAASGDLAAAREALGKGPLVGRSAHGVEEAGAAAGGGADFVVVGPVFATPSKAPFGPPLGLDALAAACRAAAPIPVFAIGGVSPERARACRDAGAHGVAAMAPLMAAVAAATPAGDAFAVLARYEEALGGL